MEYIEYFED